MATRGSRFILNFHPGPFEVYAVPGRYAILAQPSGLGWVLDVVDLHAGPGNVINLRPGTGTIECRSLGGAPCAVRAALELEGRELFSFTGRIGSNATSYTLTDLPTGDYRIYVRDESSTEERQVEDIRIRQGETVRVEL